jgi:hypothetical protein
MEIIISILLIALTLSWAFFLLWWAHPERKVITKKDFINQNFDFIKKKEEKGEWLTYKQPKTSVYNPNKDESKKMTGKFESYFFGD